jgi:hypothetical protein
VWYDRPRSEVLAQQRHGEVVDRDLFGELECVGDDVLGVDGSPFAALTLVGGALRVNGPRAKRHRCRR